jgi:hypothetical protein
VSLRDEIDVDIANAQPACRSIVTAAAPRRARCIMSAGQ